MRNGMSVEEVYAKLDRLEELEKDYAGLATDYMDLVAAYDELVERLGKAVFYFDHVSTMYANVAASPEATDADKLEFAGKISGLMEAKKYVIDILKDCLGGEEEQNDLQRETEGDESAV